MRAIILAAGRGSRMNNLSSEKPKCLVEILGQPLLNLQIMAIRNAGIKNIAIVTGYKREMLASWRLREFHNANWESSNMVTSLACASSWLEKYECIVSYSDIFYNQEIIENLSIAPGNLNVAYDPSWLDLWSKRFSDPLEDAETFKLCSKKKFITEIGGTASRIKEIEGQYMGLVKITPQAWNEIQRIRKNLDATKRANLQMTNLLQKIIDAKRIKVNAVEYKGEWGEVDTATDLHLYTNR